MALSNDLVSQFVKATKDKETTKSEKIVYGTAVIYNGEKYIKIDGSELLTPISSTAKVKDNERVTAMIKNHSVVVTGNVTSPSASESEVEKIGTKISEFEIVIADKVDTIELNAVSGRIDDLQTDFLTVKDSLTAVNADIKNLEADNATIRDTLTANQADITELEARDATITGRLDAADASIENLRAEDATITGKLNAADADIDELRVEYGEFEKLTGQNFEAVNADIDNLNASKLSADEADIKYATIENLNAEKARIDSLDADVADIDTLIFGSASGNVIQTSFANAVIAQLGNAQIKSAMIENISASKIAAGDIITNNVRVKSEDGSLIISDETIQISDETRVRVQIGKDAQNDYSINIWDADGNLMFSEGGITDAAIKDAIIRNDMVSDDANISASKLDISSLFREINGSTETIKATKIYLDDEAQTLDVAFTSMSSDLENLEGDVSSQGTQISVIQGQISSKVWQQDIDNAVSEVEGTTETLSTKYSELEQEVDGISATVSSHTTEIAKKADSSTVTTVSDKVTAVETSLDGFKSTVSSTYATKTELGNATDEFEDKTDELSTQYSTLKQTVNGLSSTVTSHTEQISKKADSSTVTTVSTKVSELEQDLDGLSATVSSHTTEIAKKADSSTVTTINTKVSELESDLNGLSATVSSNTTEIAKKADSSTVTTVNNKVTALESNLNGFKSTVSSTYATKEELDETDAKAEGAQDGVDSLTTRVSTAETKIEQNTTAIGLTATKTEVTEQINALDIGGRNLLIKSDPSKWIDTWVVYDNSTVNLLADGWVSVTKADDGTVCGFQPPLESTIPEAGEYMLSFRAYSSAACILDYMYIMRSSDGNVPLQQVIQIDTTARRYEIPLTLDSGYNDCSIMIASRNSADMFYIRDIMLEQGNKASDWSPAPEDIDADIDELTGVTESHTAEIASLQINTEAISASVSSVETMVTGMSDTITKDIEALSKQVETKMTSEEVSVQIQTALDDGVKKVVTSTGYTFDEEGLTISKSDSEMSTQITDDGMVVRKNDDAVLTANSAGVDAVNLHASTYLIIGSNSRLEDWNGRTACFWIGN